MERKTVLKAWQASFLVLYFCFCTTLLYEAVSAHQPALRRHRKGGGAYVLAAGPRPPGLLEGRPTQAVQEADSAWGFVEIFKKLLGGGEAEDEVPTTSDQRRSAWHEEERHTEFAFCTDIGFRGLHPEEGGEEAACWSRCGRVCEGVLFLAEDALPEWRLVSVGTRTKPCKTLAKKSAVQVLCKAIKKPTNFDISTAVKQEMTFDVEAQQQEQLQQQQQQQLLLQQQLQQQQLLSPAAAGEAAALAPPQSFEAAAYGRRRSGFPPWAMYLIFAAIAVFCLALLCCCACRRR
ncbi:hypothetical protein Efla_001906 [Eimeria flavescens]